MSKIDNVGYFELKTQKKNGVSKAIVLLHGWNVTKEQLKPLGAKLAGQGWRVLILDLPGFGQTPASQRPLTVGDYARFVHNFVEKKYGNKRKYVVFGHSFGGRVAVRLAFASRNTIGLILCAPSGITWNYTTSRVILIILTRMDSLFMAIPFLGPLVRRFLFQFTGEYKYLGNSPIAFATYKRVLSENTKRLLPRVKTPTLILWGDKDNVAPISGAHNTKKLTPRSLLKIFSGVGHSLPYVRPAAVASEITIWGKTVLR